MDSDSLSGCFSSFSKRYQSSLQSSSDLFMGYEEIDGDDDIMEEFPCPFCMDYYEILGLCCHIEEEHSMESDDGVCPVCYMRVGVDMVPHITLQHGNLFKGQRKRKSHKGEAQSTLSFLRKELQEGNLQSLFEDSCMLSSSNEGPDPLLPSFILRMADDTVGSPSQSSANTSSAKKNKEENSLERNMKMQSSPLSIKDKEEHARRSEFVHQMLSTIFDVTL